MKHKAFISVFLSILILLNLSACSFKNERFEESVAAKAANVKYAALTFDDGPYTPVTNKILDVLEKHNSKATFFIVGNRAELYPESVKRAYSLGCEIGNHTYSHADLCSKSHAVIEDELRGCSNVILKITGERESLFRPTGGKNDECLRKDSGRAVILWSVDTLDWSHKNSAKTARAVLDNIEDGSIVLMHDLIPSTGKACEIIIPELKKRGYELVTVSELLELNGITPEQGKRYYKAK